MMFKLTMITLAGAASVFAAPLHAQSQGSGKIEITVFGSDPCPRATDDEIVVCKRRPEQDRLRLPEAYRETEGDPATQSWAVRSQYLEENNNTGLNQCSPTGPDGQLGCLVEDIRENRRERKQLEESRTPPE